MTFYTFTSEYPWKVFGKNSNEIRITKNPVENFIEGVRKAEMASAQKIEMGSMKKCSKEAESLKFTNPPSKASTNAILKAIEQRDLKYLKTSISPENVNSTDDFGWTPLMLAAYHGYMEIVQFLLKSGANKKIREKSGWTAAQLALKKNYHDVVALLRKNDPSEKNAPKAEEPKNQVENKEEPEIYCETCRGKFVDTEEEKHQNSILHIFGTRPKMMSFFGLSRNNKGYQMLLSSGWDEEGGLGPKGKGLKYPVKTVLKTDRKGLGQGKGEARVTHFKAGDVAAVKSVRATKPQKVPTKKDREKLLARENRKERALRQALS